jgi:dTDP-4-amino-4,6-dideoxygalactose transaminase
MKYRLPFAQPELGDEEIAEVVKCIRSGWITTGLVARSFESDFESWLGGDVTAIAVNSATAGLHLGLEAMGIGVGDEVITTTHTFTATAEVIRYLGATPVFVDVDPRTMCIDVGAVEAAITSKTKAVIPVHFGGLAAEMDGLLTLALKYGLGVLEDAAHALPTTSAGQLVGTLLSDVTVFSFYANKTMTTGEGGMLVTRNPEIAKRVKIMRLHGIDRDAFDRFNSSRPSWYYEVLAPGFKYNMTDIAAAMGIQQLKKALRFHARREQISRLYSEAFADLPIILPPQPSGGDIHSWHLYVIQLHGYAKVHRQRFIELMFEQGIGCSVHYIPLHLHPYWRETFLLDEKMFPNSQHIYEHSVSLPIYSKMTDFDVDQVIKVVRGVLS